MTLEEMTAYCSAKPGVTEHFPFGPDDLVFKVEGKMFLLIDLTNQPLTLAVKGDPESNLKLREKHPQITGAYHMNKEHWNGVVCDGLKAELIKKMIDEAYALVFTSLTKKMQREITAN